MEGYAEFLAEKGRTAAPVGFEPDVSRYPDETKPFQGAVVSWAARRGRAALFEGTGLGKTLQELTWAREVVHETKRPVLDLTPLAVAEQTVSEAQKFNIDGVAYADRQDDVKTPIAVSNYDRLHLFDPSKFGGVVLDESSIIKAADGKTRAALMEFCRDIPYLLPASATPAPNDWTELGQHAELLGVMSAKEMLAMYFVHDGSNRAGGGDGWRLKRHAEHDFWAWVASWAVNIRKPSDLGYDEPGYDLPPLTRHQITVKVDLPPAQGFFHTEVATMQERIEARRESLPQRVGAAVNVVLGGRIEPQSGDEQPCGSLSTPRRGAPVIKPIMQSESAGRARVETPLQTQPTCGIGPRETKIASPNIDEPTPSRETLGVASDMPAMPSMPSVVGKASAAAAPNEDAHLASSQPSGSQSNNTTQSLSSKVVAAPCAEPQQGLAGARDWPSTTATTRESCEDFSAPIATRALESSPMIRRASALPPTMSKPPAEPWLIYCNLNDEQDALAAAFGPHAFSVFGSMTKGEKIDAIQRWQAGERPIMISKPSIIGFGLNFQHCADLVFVGLNDSFEQLYQAVRRCWRFGQSRPVNAYFIASEREGPVVANLERKERDFEAMAEAMAQHMLAFNGAAIRGGRVAASNQQANRQMELPAWLAA